MGGPLGEEPGWQGYALPKLQTMFKPAWAAVILGVLWALWHLQLFLIHGWTSSPVWIDVLILTSLSVLMALSFNLSVGRVLVAVIAHSAGNPCSHTLNGVLRGVQTKESLSGDLVIALTLVAMAAVIAWLTRGKLGATENALGTILIPANKELNTR